MVADDELPETAEDVAEWVEGRDEAEIDEAIDVAYARVARERDDDALVDAARVVLRLVVETTDTNTMHAALDFIDQKTHIDRDDAKDIYEGFRDSKTRASISVDHVLEIQPDDPAEQTEYHLTISAFGSQGELRCTERELWNQSAPFQSAVSATARRPIKFDDYADTLTRLLEQAEWTERDERPYQSQHRVSENIERRLSRAEVHYDKEEFAMRATKGVYHDPEEEVVLVGSKMIEKEAERLKSPPSMRKVAAVLDPLLVDSSKRVRMDGSRIRVWVFDAWALRSHDIMDLPTDPDPEEDGADTADSEFSSSELAGESLGVSDTHTDAGEDLEADEDEDADDDDDDDPEYDLMTDGGTVRGGEAPDGGETTHRVQLRKKEGPMLAYPLPDGDPLDPAELVAPDLTYWGLPGTGKTTTLLEVVEGELQQGVPIERLTAVTFRKLMAEEFRDRAREQMDADSLPDEHYLRTTHAACYHLLGLDSEAVISDEDRRKFCEAMHFEYAHSGGDEWAETLRRPDEFGNELFKIRSYAVNTLQHPTDCWASTPGVSEQTVDRLAESRGKLFKHFLRAYCHYKELTGKLDFDDMLLAVLDQGLCPPHDVLIEDEVQDKTPLQVAVYNQWAAKADRVYVAGDLYQTLYGFIGANVKVMKRLFESAGESRLLTESYRFGPDAWETAMGVLDRAGYPLPEVDPVGETHVENVSFDRYADLLSGPSADRETLHLVRARYLASDVVEELTAAGVPFTAPSGGWTERLIHLYNGTAKAATAFREGREAFESATLADADLTAPEAHRLAEALPAEVYRESTTKKSVLATLGPAAATARLGTPLPDGAPAESEAVAAFCESVEESVVNLLDTGAPFSNLLRSRVGNDHQHDLVTAAFSRRGGRPIEDGEIQHRVLTLHGAKGQEADRVYLHRATAPAVANNADPEEEARVWFVGATRAREELVIVEPEPSHDHAYDVLGSDSTEDEV